MKISFLYHVNTDCRNLPSHMDCSVLSPSWWECWLCIWLFPWWSKWQKAALGSPTVSRHGVCLLHLLVVFFFFNTLCDVQQPAIQSEMPLRLWIVFICEMGFTYPLGTAGQCCSTAFQAAVIRCTVLKGIERWIGCENMTNHSLNLLSASRCCLRTVDSTGFLTEWQQGKKVMSSTEKLILYSCCICTNKGLSYWILVWRVWGLQ